MTLRHYLVVLKYGEAGDFAYQQPIDAISAEEYEGSLILLAEDGSISAYFAPNVVDNCKKFLSKLDRRLILCLALASFFRHTRQSASTPS